MRLYNKGATYENIELLPWETDMLIEERNCLQKWIEHEILPTMQQRKQFVVDFGKRYKGITGDATTDFHLIVNAEPRIYTSEYPGIIEDTIIKIGVSKRYGWYPTPLNKVTDPKTLYALSDNWLKIKNELLAQLEKHHKAEPTKPKVKIPQWVCLHTV